MLFKWNVELLVRSKSNMANWEGLLKWSLKHHDGTSSEPQMDEERRQWLQEALQAIASAPTEAQLLQAALTVLRAHSSGRGEMEEEEEQHLMKTFEEIQYLIEDIDNANNLIPMNGVEVIASYLHHKKPSLVQCSCELIATATQNNPKTQEAFLATLPRLLTIISDRSLPSSVGVKAVYALSCLTRGHDLAMASLLSQGGLATLRHSLAAEDQKMVVKTLFLLMNYYSTAQTQSRDLLVAELLTLVPELISLVRSGISDEIKGHALLALVTMSTNYQEAVSECRKEEARLKSVLTQLSSSWSPEDHEDELAAVKTLTETCFPS